MREQPLRVALFVTCLVDMFRPTVGFATLKLLEEQGCAVDVPSAQTCCGQPAWNSGDTATARRIARQVIETFEGYDHVVAPSGSCAGTIVKDYAAMFAEEPLWRARAEALAAKTHEIVSFLVDVLKVERVDVAFDGAVTYHDSCSGLRGLGVKRQPRTLLAGVKGLTLTEMKDSEVCCGFGGTFCVKFPDISNKMVGDKSDAICATGADTVLAGDLGCLMNMAGKLSRDGKPVRARHVVEVLAGMADGPAIAEGRE
jgi:L-lactate dehydrogenase complex protein LldE